MKGEKTKEKKRKKRIAAIAVAGAVAVMVLVLALVNAFVFPLRYLSVLFSLPEVEARAERELALHFIDVGQGDAALIEFPDGKTLLIDGGGEESDALLRYLRALKIDTLDYLLLTHPDSDHCGGLSDVLELFGAKHIYMPYCPDETINASYAAFTSAVRKAARKGTSVHISQTFSAIVSEDVECFYYAMILLPLPYESENSAYRALVNENSDSAANDASAVVYLEYAGVRFLFTGDIGENVENGLVRDYGIFGDELFARTVQVGGRSIELRPDIADIDVLKVSHHGSASSTSAEFARLVSPRFALIGVGAGNLYGHPSPSVIERLKSADQTCEVYRTDEAGNIVLRVGEEGKLSPHLQKSFKLEIYRKKSFSEYI